MPDDWEEQKRQAQSPFNNGFDPLDVIKRAAQNAREDIEKSTKRRLLQGQDEINIRRQGLEEDINRFFSNETFGIKYFGELLEAGEIDGKPASVEQMIEETEAVKRYYSEEESILTSYQREKEADWRSKVWQNSYEPPYDDEYYPFLPDLSPTDSMLYYNDFVDEESKRIQQILENNGLTQEDIERQNRIMNREPDIEPEI